MLTSPLAKGSVESPLIEKETKGVSKILFRYSEPSSHARGFNIFSQLFIL